MNLYVKKKEEKENEPDRCWRHLLNWALLLLAVLSVAVCVILVCALGIILNFDLSNLLSQSWEVIGGVLVIVIVGIACTCIPILVLKAINASDSPDYRDNAFRILLLIGIYITSVSILAQLLAALLFAGR